MAKALAIGYEGTLPVMLSSFTAEVGSKKIVLKWKTETETASPGLKEGGTIDDANS